MMSAAAACVRSQSLFFHENWRGQDGGEEKFSDSTVRDVFFYKNLLTDTFLSPQFQHLK